MKVVFSVAIISLFMISLAPPPLASTPDKEPSANGSFQVSAGDGVTRYIDFEARTHKDGKTKGEMTFTVPSVIPEGGETSTHSSEGISVKVDFDCLVVNDNRAVMSGVIVSSNIPDSIGSRVLLIVEDNSEGQKAPAPDRLTWGVYRTPAGGWTPSDAEVEGDGGWFLSWIAKDAEREDDVGVPYSRNSVIGCQSFPISSYSFVDLQHGEGNIQVKP